MDKNLQELVVEIMKKHVQEIPMFGDAFLEEDKATILLTRMKSFSEENTHAVLDLICNLACYMIYGVEQFLDPYLYGNIPSLKITDRKAGRDFALSYLRTGGLIEVKENRIHLLSEKELRAFLTLVMVNHFSLLWLDKQRVDEEVTDRYLRIEPRGLGLRLIEVHHGEEEEIHFFQSASTVRSFFDECWKSAGTKISFDKLRSVLPLNPHQKFKPTEYLESMGLLKEDRLNRYAYVNADEGYVYFQRHFNNEPLRKMVLNEYRNKD